MRVLVIGSGGREHALVWKLSQSPLVDRIFVAPGNGGTASIAQNVEIDAKEIDKLVKFARDNNIGLVVPGPELPLTLGITDAMREAGIPCFGPDKFCAQLEGSKSFAKNVMLKANVPTAKYGVFTSVEDARKFVRESGSPLVVKADGLAAGKGVVVTSTEEEALKAVEDMLENGMFGGAGTKIIIEEKLEGEEVSLLCLCDGKKAMPLPSAQDHKAAFDHDAGPNTGGMGAYSPAPILPDAELEKMADLTVRPILEEMAKRGHPYKGILYAGLMITARGPKVLEYNARFGDPECQPLLLRLQSDLAELMLACVDGNLEKGKPLFSSKPALGVVLAAEGYPGKYPRDLPISGIDKAGKNGALVFHSGTRLSGTEIKSTGGRVLCVTAAGNTLSEARDNAYAALAQINMPHGFYRHDIGDKGLKLANSCAQDTNNN